MEIEFSGEVWKWVGPAPWYFITVPEEECLLIQDETEFVSYGWGMIPVTVGIGGSTWDTSLWPHEGAYVVPVKAAIRKAERLDEGDSATVRLSLRR